MTRKPAKKSRKKSRRPSRGSPGRPATASGAGSIEIAKQHHQSGDLPKAEEIYQRILTRDPDNAEALHFLGIVRLQSGEREQALGLIVRSIKNNPNAPNYYLNLGIVLNGLIPASYTAKLDEILTEAFSSPYLYHQHLSPIAAKLLTLKYSIPDSASGIIDPALIEKLSLDPLFLSFLKKTFNANPIMEGFLTALRRSCLLFPEDQPDGPSIPALWAALAEQCFNNEFVFCLDPREEEALTKFEMALKQYTGAPDGRPEELERIIPALAMYGPLHELPEARALADVPLDAWPPPLQDVVRRSLLEPLEEEGLKEGIQSISGLENETSRAVGRQYEENPYPRWLETPSRSKKNFADSLKWKFPHFEPPPFLRGRVENLTAGCGTGKEPISAALEFDNLNISAVDLSKSSLAYAIRMARKLGARNVEFRQDDILNLSGLGQKFHFISSTGVLHHMERPIEGWKILTDLLLPGGVMRIALYSEIARRHIAEAQERIQKAGLKATKEDVRGFRKEILASGPGTTGAWLLNTQDFFSFSDCRDLLFHVKEHRFTLPRISEILADLNLVFLGFEFTQEDIKQAYLKKFPEDPELTNLALWEKFEEEHPDTFLGMYQFWCQKPEAAR